MYAANAAQQSAAICRTRATVASKSLAPAIRRQLRGESQGIAVFKGTTGRQARVRQSPEPLREAILDKQPRIDRPTLAGASLPPRFCADRLGMCCLPEAIFSVDRRSTERKLSVTASPHRSGISNSQLRIAAREALSRSDSLNPVKPVRRWLRREFAQEFRRDTQHVALGL